MINKKQVNKCFFQIFVVKVKVKAEFEIQWFITKSLFCYLIFNFLINELTRTF